MAEPRWVGRLALRVEGETWVAYYALPDTMEGAIVLATIRMALVEDGDRKRAFMELMKSAIGDFLAGKVEMGIEQPAPEHERAGRA